VAPPPLSKRGPNFIILNVAIGRRGNIAGVTGVHDVYLTFTSGQPADFVNVNWFDFGH
jgi:hypothetical protein